MRTKAVTVLSTDGQREFCLEGHWCNAFKEGLPDDRAKEDPKHTIFAADFTTQIPLGVAVLSVEFPNLDSSRSSRYVGAVPISVNECFFRPFTFYQAVRVYRRKPPTHCSALKVPNRLARGHSFVTQKSPFPITYGHVRTTDLRMRCLSWNGASIIQVKYTAKRTSSIPTPRITFLAGRPQAKRPRHDCPHAT